MKLRILRDHESLLPRKATIHEACPSRRRRVAVGEQCCRIPPRIPQRVISPQCGRVGRSFATYAAGIACCPCCSAGGRAASITASR